MSSIEIAVKGSRRLEGLLESRFGASGKGLTEKLDSVLGRVPTELHEELRWVARIRNRVVHQEGEEISDFELFKATVDRLAMKLEGRAGTGACDESLTAVLTDSAKDLGAFFSGLVGILTIAAGLIYVATLIFGAKNVFKVVGGVIALALFILWAAHFQKSQQG